MDRPDFAVRVRVISTQGSKGRSGAVSVRVDHPKMIACRVVKERAPNGRIGNRFLTCSGGILTKGSPRPGSAYGAVLNEKIYNSFVVEIHRSIQRCAALGVGRIDIHTQLEGQPYRFECEGFLRLASG